MCTGRIASNGAMVGVGVRVRGGVGGGEEYSHRTQNWGYWGRSSATLFYELGLVQHQWQQQCWRAV